MDRFDLNDEVSNVSLDDAREAIQGFLSAHCKVEPLPGGLSNANFLIQQLDKKYVLRFFCRDSSSGDRESALLKFLESKISFSPRLHNFSKGRFDVALLGYCEGVPLANLLNQATPLTFFAVGEALRKIHDIKFSEAGFVDARGSIEHRFSNFCETAKNFLLEPLSGIAGKRLGAELCEKIKEVANVHWHSVSENFSGPVLTHGDFNPKNILLSGDINSPSISVIDWEFAISGHPMIDFGNFFRFESEDYPLFARKEFLNGYGLKLQDHWWNAALLLDLTSMIFFLNNRRTQPRTFENAIKVVRSTVDYFSK